MTTIIFGIFEEGLVYAIMALGVYITYKILDFPDLSVDGTFPLALPLPPSVLQTACPSSGPWTRPWPSSSLLGPEPWPDASQA